MIAVIFGGRSCEHDVSIVTGLMTLGSIKGAKPVYIDRRGRFWCGDKLSHIDSYRNFSTRGLRRVHFMPGESGIFTGSGKRLYSPEAVVVCCHGAYGEDGCLQGMLELSGIPYTCGGVLYALKWPGRDNPRFGCHEIFHVFILLGSLCHFFLMYNVITRI